MPNLTIERTFFRFTFLEIYKEVAPTFTSSLLATTINIDSVKFQLDRDLNVALIQKSLWYLLIFDRIKSNTVNDVGTSRAYLRSSYLHYKLTGRGAKATCPIQEFLSTHTRTINTSGRLNR